ncbi:MAG: HNH endonuclease [Acidimicrobiia bacterium]|nr:HNH endonuclease [Acidimicrobiia bacterium]MCY4456712.1 DNA methyltransferase [Acidimicrobiaceae bacterium]
MTEHANINFENRTLWTADNLDVMRGMNRETIDLIYLDPPFNSKRDYAAPLGSQAAGAAFSDTWSLDDIKQEHADELQIAAPELWHTIVGAGFTAGDSMQAYLTYMSVRLIEMRRILKSTGSIYLHCDPTASHYLKQLMDAVFGRHQFRNEIVWTYGSAAMTSARKVFPRKHDTVFFYSKSDNYVFNNPRESELSPQMQARWGRYLEVDGRTVLYGSIKHEKSEELRSRNRIIKSAGRQPRDSDVAFVAKPSLLRSVWHIPEVRNNPKYLESTGYPTQKPLALLERIIQASSNEGDMVFDPFCGCATTMVAAERLGRRWVGADIEPLARGLVVKRLTENADEMPLFKMGNDGEPQLPTITHSRTPPIRTDREVERRSPNIKQILYRQQDGKCVGKCGEREFPIDIFEVDHIVPRSKGGADIDSNLQLLCPTCNASKGNRAMGRWLRGSLPTTAL